MLQIERLWYTYQQQKYTSNDFGNVFLIGNFFGCHFYPFGAPIMCRDFGPRLAHFLLPIRGKGSSEFNYAWIPFFATLAGGAIAGCIYLALREMNQSETTISYCAEQVDFGSD
eukprot:TRINITY_DN27882_c0_g1_i2.p8 TRINITY_DN27882_c0_g1~~TRINITY_DN27882_c0_g1_i2.p8  ORF type:complete len:113 (+),score=12.01 TRINITY_DN27882_c0_g1_i2:1103-1441(+)